MGEIYPLGEKNVFLEVEESIPHDRKICRVRFSKE